uniref:Probable protein-export membrane protein SecG n=1 Tax=Protohalopteris sp. TaxID=2843287 RepID=A0A8F0F716_9PHAE|nr:hypothetical protein [Protohalopteris sp.]
MSILSTLSIFINVVLIILIIIRSPDEQSLQENLGPLQFFESSSEAESTLDNLIKILTFLYFILGLILIIQNYFF